MRVKLKFCIQTTLAIVVVGTTGCSLVSDRQYWTNALATNYGGGKNYTGFTDIEDDQGITFASFIDATPVRLLEVRDKDCKVEGQEWGDNKVVRGWVDCSRLLSYEPTPVPFGEVKLGP